MGHLSNHAANNTDGNTGAGSSRRGPWWVRILQLSGGVQSKTGQFTENMIVNAAGVVPSGAIDPQVIQYLKVTLTSAQMLALHGTPVSLIAAPGVGAFVQLLDALVYLNYKTTAYAAGSVFQLVVGGAAVATTTAALINTGSAIVIQPAFPLIGTTNSVGTGNSALTVTASAGEFTTGDSTVDVHLWYAVVAL